MTISPRTGGRPPIKKVVALYAMEAEARPLLGALGWSGEAKILDPDLPYHFYEGECFGLRLRVAINGRDPRFGVDAIGTEPAVLHTFLTLRSFRPDLCLNAGTAGGFSARGGRIGDVFLSSRPTVFHDRRIALPGFEEYGLGTFSPEDFSELGKKIGLKMGQVSTGSSLDCTVTDRARLEAQKSDAKDMEVAAIAWVCQCLRTPFVALKAITDIVDGEHPTEEEFLRHLHEASQKLNEKVFLFLKELGAMQFPSLENS